MNTKVVGILNITPDSFSDGGMFSSSHGAIQHATKMINDGADVIDVGAESTAPGVTRITAEEEHRRLKNILPEVVMISHNAGVEVSIDTRNAVTADFAASLGVDYINDQGGLLDPDMPEVAANSSARIVIMHNLGIPASRAKVMNCHTDDLIDVIVEWLRNRVDRLVARGIARRRIIVDPGLGFGKLPEQSWHIAKNIEKFRVLGLPLYVGHSRKSMFSSIANLEERDVPTAMLSMFFMQQKVDFIRVHNVALTNIAKELAKLLS